MDSRVEELGPQSGSGMLPRMALAGLNLFACLLYAVGLISPLTPSEGIPRLTDLLFFFVGPIALMSFVALRARSRDLKALVFLQIAAVVGFTSWLLWVQT